LRVAGRMKELWQAQTGEEETPFDGDTPAWVISLFVHLGLLVLLTAILREIPTDDHDYIDLITAQIEPEEETPQEFFLSELEEVEIGANSIDGVDMADALAQVEDQFNELQKRDPEVEEREIEQPVGEIVIDNFVDPDVATETNTRLAVQGAAGTGVSGAEGAIDRITQAIIDSLEQRKTLVAWLFDQSGSLSKQRDSINKRIDQIYEELGVIEASGDPRFAKHHDKPLLTSVVAFGSEVSYRTPRPTDQLPEIKAALGSIENDDSGVERVFRAVYEVADRYKIYAGGEDRRHVMIVLFTDETGDDAQLFLDRAVVLCRNYAIPVYVVGVPAPFGRRNVDIKQNFREMRYGTKTSQYGYQACRLENPCVVAFLFFASGGRRLSSAAHSC